MGFLRAGAYGLVYSAVSDGVVWGCVLPDTGNLEERPGAPPVQGSHRGVCYVSVVGSMRASVQGASGLREGALRGSRQ